MADSQPVPAVLMGIALGPLAARFLDSERWGSAEKGQTNDITLVGDRSIHSLFLRPDVLTDRSQGVTRVMIGVQLVIAGYQLPAKYNLKRWKEMALCLLPIMTIMWLCTTLCVLAAVPRVTLLAALVIASCVTCTDPILSQAIAKGPFADKYVARPLREIISSEAGANDGFGFPFLMLAVYLMRHADLPGPGVPAAEERVEGIPAKMLFAREDEVGRLGGGVGVAMKEWFLETWLYIVLLSVVYGAVVGYGSCRAIGFALRRCVAPSCRGRSPNTRNEVADINPRKWIDGESHSLFPAALGMFLVGTCGAIGTDDLLACFVAGNALNWDGEYLAETERRHDEVSSCIDVLLNFGGFMYIGTILPWSEFHDPEGVATGLTYGRLIGLGFLVLALRRIPAILLTYKLMPGVVRDWKEALFMGYFGPIGAGAVFYLEHSRHLFPEAGRGDGEETELARAIGPVVYWLVLFSIVVHGLSIPALNLAYTLMGVEPVHDDAREIRRMSERVATPVNAIPSGEDTFIAYNRFSRSVFDPLALPVSQTLGGNKGFVLDDDDEKGRAR